MQTAVLDQVDNVAVTHRADVDTIDGNDAIVDFQVFAAIGRTAFDQFACGNFEWLLVTIRYAENEKLLTNGRPVVRTR